MPVQKRAVYLRDTFHPKPRATYTLQSSHAKIASMLILLETLAATLYLWCAWRVHRPESDLRNQTLVLGLVCAVALQGLALGLGDALQGQWKLGIGQALALFLWLCCAIHLLMCLRMPLWHLGRWLWPVAALAVPLAWWLPHGAVNSVELSTPLKLHILVSMLAYATLTLAALQTVSYALLDTSLHKGRHHHHSLPPLQVMEEMIFKLVLLGFILLSISISSGFLFVDNVFAQHLAHKTALSIIACALFGALTAGRMLRGWRGRTAIRWVMGAYIILLLAYFGSKVVLEQILGRTWT